MGVAIFRVLRLEAGRDLRDNLVGMWIPELVGSRGGGDINRTAA